MDVIHACMDDGASLYWSRREKTDASLRALHNVKNNYEGAQRAMRGDIRGQRRLLALVLPIIGETIGVVSQEDCD